MATNQNQRRGLLDLPNEVLGLAMDELAKEQWNGKALSNFRQTCTKAFVLAEPAWCRCIQISHTSQIDKLRSVLKTNKHRKNLVENLVIDVEEFDKSGDDSGSLEKRLIRSISLFPNLKYLKADMYCFRSWTPDYWLRILDSALQATVFAELRECYLGLWDSKYGERKRQLEQLVRLLQAPKLTSLTLVAADLREFDPSSIPTHSTALKRLRLSSCTIHEDSASDFICKPRALESFQCDRLAIGWQYLPPELPGQGPWRFQPKFGVTQLFLEVLAREQPHLTSLKISRTYLVLLGTVELKYGFDFSKLRYLKELSLCGCRPSSRENRTDFWWCPLDYFTKLPPVIERIELSIDRGGVNLHELADALLGPEAPIEGLPVSLRQLDFIVGQDHELPFNKEDQEKDNRLHQEIARIMTGLPLSQLTYTQRHPDPPKYRKDDNRFVEWCCYTYRKLVATRKHSTDENDTPGSRNRVYDLKVVTWEKEALWDPTSDKDIDP